MRRILVLLLLMLGTTTVARGDTVIVDENFDGYADDTAFRAVWVPTVGNGSAPANAADVDSGIITADDTAFPGIQGKAVDHIGATASSPGMVNQYTPASGGPAPGNAITPSATQSVFLSFDLFDGASGNERMSVGLRNRTTTANLIEMGLYNSNSCDPTVCGPGQAGGTSSPQNATATDPGFYPGTGYGVRTQLFSSISAPLLVQPDWQYFQLPIELDRTTDVDEIVSIADIGQGWHRYTATITPTSVTYTIDLFRDGVRNDTRDETGVVVGAGTPGVDATMTFPVSLNPVGFDSLRIGGPSGLLSAGAGVTGYDNILLKLIDVATPGNDADFNNDGTVNAADYTIWRDHMGLTGTGSAANGDANGDTNVDSADYDIWKLTFGTMPGSGAVAGTSVPEPCALILSLVAGAFVAARRKRN
ncbi:MAG: dockerin type I domain-containing protein [Pirellulales bacterium]